MLGISIYPEKQDTEEIINYLKTAQKYGFKKLFSCLLSVNGNQEEIVKKFSYINKTAHDLGYFIVLDVNPRVFDQLGVSYDNLKFFKDIYADGIRLDMGFDGKKEADMTFNEFDLDIEINISNDNKYLDNIMSNQPKKNKLISCHNFYPQKYTGLSLEFFTKITQKFKDYGIKTAAFISSNFAQVGPWPLNHGLPTLEIYRGWNIESQAKFLYATQLVDDIIIGNSFASEKELQLVGNLEKSKVIHFNLNKVHINSNTRLENEILFNNKHFRRGDTNEYCVRSTQSRVKYKNEAFPAHDTPEILKRGDVVICNDNYAQYKGELQIILKDMVNIDNGKNVVGKVNEEELILLDYLRPLERFGFKNEEN